MECVTDQLDRFYSALAKLDAAVGGKRLMADVSGRSGWPTRGVYFFFLPGEHRASESRTLRVVRVGTHGVSLGSRSTLWKRLAQHRGTRALGGNHRGSIFRLHVGAAMLLREHVSCPTWGDKSSASRDIKSKETEIERAVSEYIRSHLVLWVSVPDEPSSDSRRCYVERNAIALLSQRLKPIDPPSAAWLGRSSPDKRIVQSGLWNLQHIEASCDDAFLPEFEAIVDDTIRGHVA